MSKMGLRKLAKKYKEYENKELARRAIKKKKVRVSLAANRIKKIKLGKFDKVKFTKALGNPYKVKL